jgi:hypothetical protein
MSPPIQTHTPDQTDQRLSRLESAVSRLEAIAEQQADTTRRVLQAVDGSKGTNWSAILTALALLGTLILIYVNPVKESTAGNTLDIREIQRREIDNARFQGLHEAGIKTLQGRVDRLEARP